MTETLFLSMSGVTITALVLGMAMFMPLLYGNHTFNSFSFLSVLFLSWGVVMGACLYLAIDAPGLYTRVTGTPQPVRIRSLHYFSGLLGLDPTLRVDTDRGVFLLDSDAPVPDSGTLYVSTRRRFFGHSTRKFLCLNQAECWALKDEFNEVAKPNSTR